MLDVLSSAFWSDPILAIPSSLWSNIGVGSGFLTPTPIRLPNGNLRVFGGVRDSVGRSTINFVDLNPITAEILDYSKNPCLDSRNSNGFDTDGAILGDIFPYDDGIAMFYVGFRRYSDVKFRAYTGFAVSIDLGRSWKKEKSPISELQQSINNSDIFAVHHVRITNTKVELLIALGDGWEEINGEYFPRYSTFWAHGKTFSNLEISDEILLPQNYEVYRLGRPRFFMNSQSVIECIVATGGIRNGDYRPYIYEKTRDTWEMSKVKFPILPGFNENFSLQVSYPACIEMENSTWIFFNGDQMGKAGSYLICSGNKINV